MANSIFQTKPSSLSALAIGVIVICFTLWSFTKYQKFNVSTLLTRETRIARCPQVGSDLRNRSQEESEAKTFYDDPETHYTIDKPMTNWDEKRKEWLKLHPTFSSGTEDRVLIVTGSQPAPCKYPTGDHFLLRLFKNKVDYCRINHGYDIFYNNAFLDPKMSSVWAKLPLLRAAMLAHPEKEWIFWIDSDAMFTDMSFNLPLQRYKDYNFVISGWPERLYEKKSWLGLSTGVFLIRNCQWSMDFLDAWASMGPKSPDFAKWSDIARSIMKEVNSFYFDDQTALVYLVLKEKEKWVDKIYMHTKFDLNGYWLGIVWKYDNITKEYEKLERSVPRLRRRHAELISESYTAEEAERQKLGDFQRPFITHFAGCQICSGKYNPAFKKDSCWVEMERALNFADNQVLRNYGFMRTDLGDASVTPVPFDYPSAEI